MHLMLYKHVFSILQLPFGAFYTQNIVNRKGQSFFCTAAHGFALLAEAKFVDITVIPYILQIIISLIT